MTDIIKQFFKNLVCSESEPIIGPPEDLEKELKQALAKETQILMRRIQVAYANNSDLELKHLLVLQGNLTIYFNDFERRLGLEEKS